MVPSPNRAGRFVTQMRHPEGFVAFVPAALWPEPSIQWDSELHDLLEIANRELGRLDGASTMRRLPRRTRNTP
jgi:hypothetical protein